MVFHVNSNGVGVWNWNSFTYRKRLVQVSRLSACERLTERLVHKRPITNIQMFPHALSLSACWNNLLHSWYLLRQNTGTYRSVIHSSFPSFFILLRSVTTETWRNYPYVLRVQAVLPWNVPVNHFFIRSQACHIKPLKVVQHQYKDEVMGQWQTQLTGK